MAVPSRPNRVAHLLERVGLATAGASCGLFVAAYLAKSGIHGLMSIGFVLAMMVAGAVGFYLGIDMPGRAREAGLPVAGRVEIMSALGTFIAPVAALICVVAIVLDIDPRTPAVVLLGLCWLAGVVLQVVAGISARSAA
jgi:hypothetical protein